MQIQEVQIVGSHLCIVKTYRKLGAQKSHQFFCWVEICSSYGFYLHIRVLKPSNNFIQIVLMRWIKQAFMLGPSWDLKLEFSKSP